MLKEKEIREKLEEEVRLQKQQKKEEQLKAQLEKDAQKKIPPWEIFQKGTEAGKYSKFDDKGIPTHDAEGTPIPKSGLKKLQKVYAAQEKKYNDYLSSESKTAINSNPSA
jgi:cysteinyl-tRNA synthetase